MSYRVEFSDRARKDFNRLNRTQQVRIAARIDELGMNPYDPRISGVLTAREGLRRSRVGGWRIIFAVDDDAKVVRVVTMERRGQVYKRL